MPAFKVTTSPNVINFGASDFSSTMTPGQSNWQAAILSGANVGNSIAFNVLGTGSANPTINALQIAQVVEFLQPSVLPSASNNGIPVPLEYPSLPLGDYVLMHVHGAINTNSAPPQFAGGWYSLTYSTSNTPPSITKVNYPEIGRYTSGPAASAAYSGNKTFFSHAGGNIILQYVNESGDYANVTVTQDPNTVSTYLATGVSYPTAITSTTDPIAPVFALMSLSALNAITSYTKPPLFVPGEMTFENLITSSYAGVVQLWSEQSGATYYYTTSTTPGTEPGTPASSAGTSGGVTTYAYSSGITLTGPTQIKAIAVVGGAKSPVSYINYS